MNAAPSTRRRARRDEILDAACRVTMAGIRKQHPAATEEVVLQILRERLEWARRREDAE